MKTIFTKNAPEPIGPYSQAIEAGGFVFVSGQIPLKDGKMVEGGIKKQTLQVLKNIEAILSEAGLSKKDIVKASIFLTDLSYFKDMNEVYENFLEGHKPARETVEVSNLPAGALVEISVIAHRA